MSSGPRAGERGAQSSSRAGIGWIIAGVVLSGTGLSVSILSQRFVLYGAVIVGLVWIVRGVRRVIQSRRPTGDDDRSGMHG